jgi:uncharacterized protein (TIGR01777 family)
MMPVMPRFIARSRLPATAGDVFAWHARPGAFERLAPPWENVRTVGPEPDLADGTRRTLRVGLGPLGLRWVAVHRDIRPGRGFRDVQESGPFAAWTHVHSFHPLPGGECRLEDRVDYDLPLGALGRVVGGAPTLAKLEAMFRHRHEVTMADLDRHRRHADRPRKTVAITGASGLVGTALAAFLRTGGHRVVEVVRRAPEGPDEIRWDPVAGTTDPADWDGVDAVVHLAGENIAGGRWSAERKRRIRDSRVAGTRLLARTLAALDRRPEVFVSASAIGYYGARDGEGPLGEDAEPGDGFLPEVAIAWEGAADPARAAGIRVVHPRIGIVLSARGGALAKMLPPFRMGAGGRLGHGRQHMAWIALDDLVGVLHEAILDERYSGPVNAVAPGGVDNRTFTDVLGRVLRRPTVLPAPALALRVALGEMADALLLTGADVRPDRLERLGFEFRFPTLEPALRAELGRRVPPHPEDPRFERS